MRQTLALAIAVLLSGCARPAHPATVRALASNDLDCSESQIRIVDAGSGALRAFGCGLTAGYVCVVERRRSVCTLASAPVGSRIEPPTPSAPAARTGSTVEVDALAARLRVDVLACSPSDSEIVVPVVLTPDGEVRRLGSTLTPGAAACVDRALASVRLDGLREERSIVLRFSRAGVGDEAPRATGTVDAAQAARAAVDGRARAPRVHR